MFLILSKLGQNCNFSWESQLNSFSFAKTMVLIVLLLALLKQWFFWNKDHVTNYILSFSKTIKRFLLPLLILDEHLNAICDISFHVELSVFILQYCMTCNLQVLYRTMEEPALHPHKSWWCVHWMTSLHTCKKKKKPKKPSLWWKELHFILW